MLEAGLHNDDNKLWLLDGQRCSKDTTAYYLLRSILDLSFLESARFYKHSIVSN